MWTYSSMTFCGSLFIYVSWNIYINSFKFIFYLLLYYHTCRYEITIVYMMQCLSLFYLFNYIAWVWVRAWVWVWFERGCECERECDVSVGVGVSASVSMIWVWVWVRAWVWCECGCGRDWESEWKYDREWECKSKCECGVCVSLSLSLSLRVCVCVCVCACVCERGVWVRTGVKIKWLRRIFICLCMRLACGGIICHAYRHTHSHTHTHTLVLSLSLSLPLTHTNTHRHTQKGAHSPLTHLQSQPHLSRWFCEYMVCALVCVGVVYAYVYVHVQWMHVLVQVNLCLHLSVHDYGCVFVCVHVKKQDVTLIQSTGLILFAISRLTSSPAYPRPHFDIPA